MGSFSDTDSIDTSIKSYIDIAAQRIEAETKIENTNTDGVKLDEKDKEVLAVQAYVLGERT